MAITVLITGVPCQNEDDYYLATAKSNRDLLTRGCNNPDHVVALIRKALEDGGLTLADLGITAEVELAEMAFHSPFKAQAAAKEVDEMGYLW